MAWEEAAVWGVRRRPGTISDAEARKVLAEHGGLIHFCAKRYRMPAWCVAADHEDLLAVGRMALLQAWMTYEGSRAQFSTWAIRLIRQAFADMVRRARSQTVVERNDLMALRVHERWVDRKARGLPVGDEPPRPSAARATAARAVVERRFWSMDGPSTGAIDSEREAQFDDGSHLARGEMEDAAQALERQQLKEWLRAKLANGVLNEQERAVMQDRARGRDLAKIGVAHGLSRERIRQIEVRALEKLREAAIRDGVVDGDTLEESVPSA